MASPAHGVLNTFLVNGTVNVVATARGDEVLLTRQGRRALLAASFKLADISLCD